jgi:hypothetical protein
MREITAHCAAGLAVLLLASCASPKPASPPGAAVAAAVDSIAADTVSSGPTDDGLFIEKHAALLVRLAPRELEPHIDPRTIEARSFVTAAEEMYLRGKTLLALDLLDQADTILRRGN